MVQNQVLASAHAGFASGGEIVFSKRDKPDSQIPGPENGRPSAHHVNKQGQPSPSRLPYRELRRRIDAIPALFGRLTYVAALLDPESGRYVSPAENEGLGPQEAHDTLRQAHVEIFESWLFLSLADQASDLKAYLQKYLAEQGETLGGWMRGIQYMKLVPADARQPQRDLFRSNVEMLLYMLYVQAP